MTSRVENVTENEHVTANFKLSEVMIQLLPGVDWEVRRNQCTSALFREW